MNTKKSLSILLILILLLGLPPLRVHAGSSGDGSPTLTTPGDYTSCAPSDTISASGLLPGEEVTVDFFYYNSITGINDWIYTNKFLASGTGTLSVPFIYPTISPGTTRRFSARFLVFRDPSNPYVPTVKLEGQWYITCEGTPTPTPPPTETPTPTPPPTETPTPPPTETPTPTPPPTETPTPTPPPAFQGCTPGYWRNHTGWTGYTPASNFEAVFGVDATFSPTDFGYVVQIGGGGEKALARHAVAALLNAAHAGVDYPYTEAQIIAMVQAAYASGNFEPTKNLFDAANNYGCPLN